jgi:hypothetical protein
LLRSCSDVVLPASDVEWVGLPGTGLDEFARGGVSSSIALVDGDGWSPPMTPLMASLPPALAVSSASAASRLAQVLVRSRTSMS